MWFRRKKKLTVMLEPSILGGSKEAATEGSHIATRCGHPTEVKGKVTAFDRMTYTKMPVVADEVEYCLACIGGMAICCAWCGEVIFIGDPVTLYSAKRGFKSPEYAVRYGRHQFIGCLSMDCAETGGDRSGFWIPGDDGKGRVMRVLSPLEQAMMSNDTVMISDIGDMSQAVHIQD
jgi:hypothetical protein